jgi:hypothetical protein
LQILVRAAPKTAILAHGRNYSRMNASKSALT